ncbi:YihY/virulence factor BrkB family protein, partial [Frankia sp. CiP1_Cm_nod1]|uniref:YihY/virulence factor BrkB family protein n=1 Tax=Frankia sp. CiP1_Cm_nod1 TaxID=2897160 RepID=UPI0020245EB8
MANPISAVRSGARKASGVAGSVRRGRPFVDHAIRGYHRYVEDGGDRLAAAATYFAFLSFFPLVALAFSITGFVVDAYPDVQQELVNQINSYLPGMADKLDIASIGNSKVGVGLIGLAGLLLAGLAWINALRDAIRIIWHQSVDVGNALVRRLRDLGVLVGLGLIVFASIAVTSVITSVSGTFLEGIGLSGSTAATVVTTLLALGIALALDVTIFLCLFLWLPSITDRRRVVRGAMLGAVGVESLKLLGTWLVGMTTGNPVYGTFAVIVGLLIWINIVLRWTLLVAAWTVTAPYDSDVVPSGTAVAVPGDGATEAAVAVPDDGATEVVTAVPDGGTEAAGGAAGAAGPAGDPPPAGSPAARPPTGAVAGSADDGVDVPALRPGPSA